MPIKECVEDKKPGFRYGDTGKCYTVEDPEDEKALLEAKKKAIKQAIAIHGSEAHLNEAYRKIAQVIFNSYVLLNSNCKQEEKSGSGPGSCSGSIKSDIIVTRVHRDNPGGDWLAREREYAKNQYEKTGRINAGAVTATLDGRLPTDMLAKLPGVNKEHTNKNILNDFKSKRIRDSIKNEGVKEPIMLYVGFNGKAYIAEGNHRVHLADEFKLKDVPVDIRYFAGGELVDGNFKLRNFEKDTDPKYVKMENQLKVQKLNPKRYDQTDDIDIKDVPIYDVDSMSAEEFNAKLKKEYEEQQKRKHL